MLCRAPTNPLLWGRAFAAADLKPFLRGFLIYLFFLFTLFKRKKCAFYIFILLFLPLSGGFVGDGHPVGPGQPAAGKVQDTGWNR